MGTFVGHVAPGLFFIIFSVHWSISIFSRYYKSLGGKPSKKFQCTKTYPLVCWPKLHLEGYIMILFTILGIIHQIAKGVQDEYPYIRVNCLQHIAMYFFFAVNGVFDVLIARGYRLPRNTDYATAILAVIIAGLLFSHHGHIELHWAMHRFIVYVATAGAATLSLEMIFKENVLCAIVRTTVAFLLGTWFIQTAFVMYNPFPTHYVWDTNNHQDTMMITVYFTLHVALALFYVITVGLVMNLTSGNNLNTFNKENYQKLLEHEHDSGNAEV